MWPDHTSAFNRLKKPAKRSTWSHFNAQIAHLRWVDSLGDTDAWFDGIAPSKIADVAGEASAATTPLEVADDGHHVDGGVEDRAVGEQPVELDCLLLLGGVVVGDHALVAEPAEGRAVTIEDLAVISPYITENIKRFADYPTDELAILPAAFDHLTRQPRQHIIVCDQAVDGRRRSRIQCGGRTRPVDGVLLRRRTERCGEAKA